MRWRDRYVETVTVKASDIQPHPNNPKIHGENQLSALTGILDEVGKVDSLKAYRRADGKLVYWDGHARMGLDPNEKWRVDVYDLTENEVKVILRAFDPVGWLAQQSKVQIETLMQDDLQEHNTRLSALLADQAKQLGIGIETGTERPKDSAPQLTGLEYRIIILCKDEADQSRLLRRFEEENLNCRALIS